ncbi:XrtA/PEP-CTERM system-associated ATPase [Geothermobacter hydrogeniphilus]|uniref:AAA+ ATPase domain-containing protein n=1 Tax=Geothermobacter hydrogeniphilus TaxID=1969733 RepID=A0A1X0YEH6_9BACT|nr:XrtA/PEP-CTERM system-associated ATPase [Geothermobacter hydrogeniphilus]ORJ63384.1 hypothetical protein B5V00_00530 [Geothermobacter hydrogeniphilus]
MYEQFFHLQCKPFELVPNPAFFYLSRTHRKALSYLEYGIRERAGFVLLTGEVGSGKTTLIHNILSRLEGEIVTARVFNTRVDPTQLLTMINEDFGLSVENRQKIDLLRDLNEFLVSQYAERRQPVLIIDEAQNLSPDSLEEIRLLSNLEAVDRKLLQIVLVGQPELKTIIRRPELRQLRQRINISCHLGPLNEKETEEYFFHRLECAGNAAAVTLPGGAFSRIHRRTDGLPRLVNIVGDYLLLAAFTEGDADLNIELIDEVLADLADGVTFAGSCECVAGTVDADDCHNRLNTLEKMIGKSENADRERGSIQERLLKHENILRKVISGQREQLAGLHTELEKVCLRMEGIEDRLDRVLKLQDRERGAHKDRARTLLAKLSG